MIKKLRVGLAAFALVALIGVGCGTTTTESTTAAPPTNAFTFVDTAPTTTPGTSANCVLPSVWGEVSNIFKDCQIKEVEKGSGYSQVFNPEGANGIFDYCNTLVFRRYSTAQGDLYTYEKVRYTHLPNSEAGEYRITKALYDSITNSRPCTTSAGRYGDIDDDTLSADLFPSRNYHLGEDLPDINVLPQKDSDAAFANQIPVQQPAPSPSPNGTYTNSYGNTVPSPYFAPSAPAGATAQCSDGTYSFSQHRSGTCSHHGGVAEWY